MICHVQEADQNDVNKAVESAKAAFKTGSTWRTMDASERGVLLHKLADLIKMNAEYIAVSCFLSVHMGSNWWLRRLFSLRFESCVTYFCSDSRLLLLAFNHKF